MALGEDGERAALRQRARRCPVPGVALQALALLDEPDWPEPIVRFARGLPEAERALRRELLSVEEAERRVGRR